MFKRDRNIIVFIALLIYRIPLSRIIGDNGMGYLSGPMEVYLCMSLLLGTGFLSTMQVMMKDRMRSKQYINASQVFSISSKFAYIFAIVMLAINIPCYDFISTKLLSDSGQRLAFIFVGPAIAISILNYLKKGYLAGTNNLPELVLDEIGEAVLLGVFMIMGAEVGQKYGNKVSALLSNEDISAMYGAMGAMAGLCIAELITLISLIIMGIIYQRSLKHMMKSDASRKSEFVSDVQGHLISGIVLNGLQAFIIQLPVILLIVFYRKYGIRTGADNINSMIGAFYAKYLSIVGILSSVAVLVVPGGIRGVIAAVSEADDRYSDKYAADRLERVFARTLYFTIPATVFTAILSSVLIDTMFTGMVSTVKNILPLGSIIVVLYPVLFILISLLIRLQYNKEVLFMSVISLAALVVLGFIFILGKGDGLQAMSLILIADYGLDILLCFFALIRNMKIKLYPLQHLIFPLIISGILGILIKLLSGVLVDTVGSLLTLAICLVPAYFIYNIACMFMRVVSGAQMDRKFLGSIFVSIGQNLGIY